MNAPRRSALPPAYAGFADLFSQFEPPMMRTLFGLLSAYASRLDLPALFDDQPQGQFTGFDGISNAGDLAHLLESDWLVREIDPDDFVRRVAEREVLYRKRAFEDAGTRNTLAVVLECGPWMLGRNRLCGLAALFHLAAVAQRNGAVLKWMVPGKDHPRWQEGLSRDTITSFLGQIVQVEPDQAGLDRAMEALEIEGKLDLWYVGPTETAETAGRIDASAQFLIQSLSAGPPEPDARVTVRMARRRMVVDITFPDEDTCVAALRRPFRPVAQGQAKDPVNPSDMVTNGLSKLPFETRWTLDRHNMAVVVRTPEGLLWQPLMPDQGAGIWVPLPDPTRLMGLTIDRAARLSLLVAQPSDARAGLHDPVTLTRFDLRRDDAAPDVTSFGLTMLNRSQQSPLEIPPLSHDGLEFITRNGKRRTIAPLDRKTFQKVTKSDDRVLFCGANYRVDLTTKGKQSLCVTSINRRKIMLRAEIDNRIATLAGQARRVLFTPSSTALAVSRDGREYTVFTNQGESTALIPDGLHLLQLEATRRGIAWDPSAGEVIQLSLSDANQGTETLAKTDQRRLEIPRHCPITGTVFTLQNDEDGNAVRILPVLARRGWKDARQVDLIEAIAEARTQWLVA